MQQSVHKINYKTQISVKATTINPIYGRSHLLGQLLPSFVDSSKRSFADQLQNVILLRHGHVRLHFHAAHTPQQTGKDRRMQVLFDL